MTFHFVFQMLKKFPAQHMTRIYGLTHLLRFISKYNIINIRYSILRVIVYEISLKDQSLIHQLKNNTYQPFFNFFV